MKKSVLMFGALLIGLSSIPSYSNTFMVYGIGQSSCGKWVKAVNEERSSTRYQSFDSYISWINGYLSGHSYLLAERGQKLTEVDDDTVELFITQHCLANPLDYIIQPVIDLSKKLTVDK